MQRKVFLCLLTMALVPALGSAQLMAKLTNPTVSVGIQHPPRLSITMERVVIRSEKPCADELRHSLTQRFVGQGVEVMDRQHLDKLLEEKDFGLTGHVDRSTVTQLGKLSGATTLIVIDELYCDIDQTKSYYTSPYTKATTYTATTEAKFKGSVQVIDLTTGRISSAIGVEKTHKEDASSNQGHPAFPDSLQVRSQALDQASGYLVTYFFPWSEIRELYFFNNKECNLKDAYRLLKAGDVEGASQLSELSYETCQGADVKPKHKAQSQYNLGMIRFIEGRYEEALEYLQASYAADSTSITAQAVGDCRKAIAAREAMEQFFEQEEQVQLAARESGDDFGRPPPPPSTAEPATSPLEKDFQLLKDLYDKGLLTETEYQAKKAQLLEKM